MTENPLPLDRLIAETATDAGLTAEQVGTALTGALGLLQRHAAAEPLAALYAAVPGAEDAARSKEARPRRGGLLGGLMKSAGGVSGAAIAEAMGLLDGLKAQGVDRETLKRMLPLIRNRIRASDGRDLLGEAVKSVPGLGALLGGDKAKN